MFLRRPSQTGRRSFIWPTAVGTTPTASRRILPNCSTRGYTVFRVLVASEPKFTVLEQRPDVARAVRFIRSHAKDYGIDPDRIGIEGASSGGHLSLLAAMGGDDGNPRAGDPIDRVSSRVQAAAVFFPLTDLLNYGAPGTVQGATWGRSPTTGRPSISSSTIRRFGRL